MEMAMEIPADSRLAIPVHPVQLAFIESNAIFRGFVGGRGSGKTFILIYDLMRRAIPGRHYIVASPTFPRVKDTTVPMFHALCEMTQRKYSIRETDYRGWFETDHGGKANIVFRGGGQTDPDSFRGPNLTHAAIDEGSLTLRDSLLVLIACLREGGQLGSLSTGFTPRGTAHWTYDLFHQGKGIPGDIRASLGDEIARASTALFHCRTTDNPFVQEEFYGMLVKQYGSSTTLGMQELGGEFIENSGAAIRLEWILKCQVEHSDCLWPNGRRPRETGPLYMGVDYGGKRDCAVIWTFEKVGDVLWCRELLVIHQSNPQYAGEVIADVVDREITARISPSVVKCAIDQGAQGGPTADRMAKLFGARIEPMSLPPGQQRRLVEQLANGFERGVVRVPEWPNDSTLREDLQLVEIDSSTGEINTSRKSGIGHADRFWAMALAYDMGCHRLPALIPSPPRGVASKHAVGQAGAVRRLVRGAGGGSGGGPRGGRGGGTGGGAGNIRWHG
jgi:hypothetical protein